MARALPRPRPAPLPIGVAVGIVVGKFTLPPVAFGFEPETTFGGTGGELFLPVGERGDAVGFKLILLKSIFGKAVAPGGRAGAPAAGGLGVDAALLVNEFWMGCNSALYTMPNPPFPILSHIFNCLSSIKGIPMRAISGASWDTETMREGERMWLQNTNPS